MVSFSLGLPTNDFDWLIGIQRSCQTGCRIVDCDSDMNKNKTDQNTDKKEDSKPIIIAIFAVIAVLVIVLIFILVGRSDEADAPVDQTGDQSTTEVNSGQASGQESSDEEPASELTPEPAPIPPTESESPTVGLPEAWDRLDRQARLDFWDELDDQGRDELWGNLSSRAKTSLNPFDCPANEYNIVHLSAETGECLVSDTETETELPVTIPDNALIVSLGEAFIYSEDSEVTVTGLSCVNLEFFTLPIDSDLTLGRVLSEKPDEYAKYKADSYALLNEYFEQNLNFAYLEYYAYLSSFEDYLADEGRAVDGGLAEQLIEYLACDISVTLKNIGEDSTFSDGCGLRFDKPVSLVGQRRIYGESHRNRLYEGIACTQALVDFPTGATDRDTVSFIVRSADQITEILVQGPDNAFRVVLGRD